MGGILSFVIAMGGLSLALGIGGAVWGLLCRHKTIRRILSRAMSTLPMLWEDE